MSTEFSSEGFDLDVVGKGEDVVLELNGKVTPEVVQQHEPTEASDSFKQRGNEFFKSGNFSDAYDAYTLAIGACPGNHTGAELLAMKQKFEDDEIAKRRAKAFERKNVGEKDSDSENSPQPMPTFSPPDHPHPGKLSTYHCNRAACLLYLGKYNEVIDDCTIALMLNPNYVKAFLRRMAAHEKIDEVDNALKDAQEAYRIDPTNNLVRGHVDRLKKISDERMEKLKEETMGKLKDLGNSILGNFGMSMDTFTAEKDPNTGSYSIKFEQ